VDCGGQRRPYDFAFDNGEATLVYADTANWTFTLAKVDGSSWATDDRQFGGDHGRMIHGVCAVGDRSFVTCSEDNSVKLYTPSKIEDSQVGDDWRCTQTLDLHIGPVKCLASCDEFVVSGGARSQWFLYRVITDENGGISLWVENGGMMMLDQEGVESARIMAADITLAAHMPSVILGDSAGNVWSGHGEPRSLQFSSIYHRSSACLAVTCGPSETGWPSVAGYADGNLVRLDDRKCLPVHAAGVNALAWTSKGHLVSGGDDQDLVVSDIKRMIVLSRVSLAHLAGIHALAAGGKVLNREFEEIYSLGWDRQLKTWAFP
ncbi:WD repeat-containing protein 6, partial [Perkinsus chesapeaki]